MTNCKDVEKLGSSGIESVTIVESNEDTSSSSKNGKQDSSHTARKDETKVELIANGGINSNPIPNPISLVARDGDYVLLEFGDGRMFFTRSVTKYKGQAPLKIQKRTYSTAILVGLPYGTVLELVNKKLVPLPEGEEVVPPIVPQENKSDSKDNRNLVDNNTSQAITQRQVEAMRDDGCTSGSAIVAALIKSSATFAEKTEFSQAKYIARKQMKYQRRCRLLRCTAANIAEALYLKDPRRIMNLREDSLAQILSYGNVYAGCQVLVFESCMGLLTGALAHRMGGYGKILSVYTTHQPGFTEMVSRFNPSLAEYQSIKWIPSWDVFADDVAPPKANEVDQEALERDQLKWPCEMQDHTLEFVKGMSSVQEQSAFLEKRAGRFARKLTRHTSLEARRWLHNQSGSLIIATRHDPTETLLKMLPFLAPSCNFVVFYEYIEPLLECFLELQKRGLAINLRLTDTWYREYQVLDGRTHPNMKMSQSGGFILTGIKLSPEFGHVHIDESIVKEYREQNGGRRGKKGKKRKISDPKTGEELVNNDDLQKNGQPSDASNEENNTKKLKGEE